MEQRAVSFAAVLFIDSKGLQSNWQAEMRIWNVPITTWQCSFLGFRKFEQESILSAETFCELIHSSDVLPGKECRGREKRFPCQQMCLWLYQRTKCTDPDYNLYLPRDLEMSGDIMLVRTIQIEGFVLCCFSQNVSNGKKTCWTLQKGVKFAFISLAAVHIICRKISSNVFVSFLHYLQTAIPLKTLCLF